MPVDDIHFGRPSTFNEFKRAGKTARERESECERERERKNKNINNNQFQ